MQFPNWSRRSSPVWSHLYFWVCVSERGSMPRTRWLGWSEAQDVGFPPVFNHHIYSCLHRIHTTLTRAWTNNKTACLASHSLSHFSLLSEIARLTSLSEAVRSGGVTWPTRCVRGGTEKGLFQISNEIRATLVDQSASRVVAKRRAKRVSESKCGHVLHSSWLNASRCMNKCYIYFVLFCSCAAISSKQWKGRIKHVQVSFIFIDSFQ